MARNKSWYRFENKADDDTTTICVYDEVSAWGVTAKDFISDLNDVKTGAIQLRINSPGGDVFDGFAIYNALRQHPATVNVQVDGLAASIASIIAMAGDEIRMAKNSFMMIHNAWSWTAGNAADMRKMADTLDKIDGKLVGVYQDKTGCAKRDIKQIMADETWLTADEALEKGFCDAVGDPAEVKAKFDLSKFRNTPQAVVAMNISNEQPSNERELEAVLRDAGISKKEALTAIAGLKTEALRDSEAADAQKFKEYLQLETLKSIIR